LPHHSFFSFTLHFIYPTVDTMATAADSKNLQQASRMAQAAVQMDQQGKKV